MQKQHGFTLIELMIVVAIIGILAAIAIPQYQDYVARAQATEAFTATSGLKTDIGVYLSENGSLTGVAADAQVANTATDIEGQYIGEVTVTDAGVISVPFTSGVHNGDGPMTLAADLNTAETQISGWICDGLEPQYLPSSCRAAATEPE